MIPVWFDYKLVLYEYYDNKEIWLVTLVFFEK